MPVDEMLVADGVDAHAVWGALDGLSEAKVHRWSPRGWQQRPHEEVVGTVWMPLAAAAR